MAVNPEIKKKTEKIRYTAPASEVRESIADGMDLTSEEANETRKIANSTENRQTKVETDFKALQREYTENGNGEQTSAEITLARDGELVLADRLDRDFRNVNAQLTEHEQELNAFNAQLAQTATKSELQQVSLSYKESYDTLELLQAAYPTGDVYNHVVKTDGLIYTYKNGWISTEIQANGTGIPPRSVDMEKLDFTVQGKNRFNKDAVTVERFLNDDGTLTFSGNYNVSELIPVTPGETIHLNLFDFGSVQQYDSTGLKLGIITETKGKKGPFSFTIPSGAYGIRFTVIDAHLNDTILESGNTFTGWEKYGKKIPISVIEGITDVINVPKVTTYRIGSDFQKVSDAHAYIKANHKPSEFNRFLIIIPAMKILDTYRSLNWVDVVGEDKYKSIIEYTGSLETWNDTSTVFLESRSLVSNLTLVGIDTKYPMHVDKATGKWTAQIENTRMVHKGSPTDVAKAGTPLGIGLYQGQHLIVKNSELIGESGAFGSSGVYFHNQWDSIGTGYRSFRLEECEIKGVTYGIRPNDVEGGTSVQRNDAYLINNIIKSTHQEYYYPENSPAWRLFKRGNEYTQG